MPMDLTDCCRRAWVWSLRCPVTSVNEMIAWAVIGRRVYTLTSASSAPTTRYAAIAGQNGGWYAISAGVWAGYWIRGGPGITLR